MAYVVVAVVVALVLLVVAWWASGRSRAGEQDRLARQERGEAEARAMRQYRGPQGTPPTVG